MSKFVPTIKFRLAMTFGTSAFLAALIGLVGMFGLTRLKSEMVSPLSTGIVSLAQLSDIRWSTQDISASFARIRANPAPDYTARLLPGIRADLAAIDRAWSGYYSTSFNGSKERQVTEGLARDLVRFKAQSAAVVSSIDGKSLGNIGDRIDRAGDSADALGKSLMQAEAFRVADARRRIDENSLAFNISFCILGASLFIALAASAFGYFHVHRVVCGGLDRQRRKFEHLAQTLDLSNRSASPRNDEFGYGAVWFDRFMRRVEETVVAVLTSTESVGSATREIAAGNMDLSSRTEEQAASLEETASSMMQLTETVKQNAGNARQASALAKNASDMADAGDDAVLEMVRTIEKISQASTMIAEITGLIEGIAFQTNILALNAAVEAARAGEQGRGFAVVASEVRSLAQRSSVAAKEINELISSSVALVRDGSHQAVGVRAGMGQVKMAIRQVSEIAGEIADASEEQSRGIEQVALAVAQMDQVTQQNAALVEQAAAAAHSLEEQTIRLRDTVSAFKVGAAVSSPSSRPSLLSET